MYRLFDGYFNKHGTLDFLKGLRFSINLNARYKVLGLDLFFSDCCETEVKNLMILISNANPWLAWVNVKYEFCNSLYQQPFDTNLTIFCQNGGNIGQFITFETSSAFTDINNLNLTEIEVFGYFNSSLGKNKFNTEMIKYVFFIFYKFSIFSTLFFLSSC